MSTTDEIMGMVQEYASAWSLVGSRFDNGHGMECAEEARAALLKAVEALAVDAARYRWLRNALDTTDAEFFIAVDSPRHIDRWALPVDEVDAAIDAAMKDTP